MAVLSPSDSEKHQHGDERRVRVCIHAHELPILCGCTCRHTSRDFLSSEVAHTQETEVPHSRLQEYTAILEVSVFQTMR